MVSNYCSKILKFSYIPSGQESSSGQMHSSMVTTWQQAVSPASSELLEPGRTNAAILQRQVLDLLCARRKEGWKKVTAWSGKRRLSLPSKLSSKILLKDHYKALGTID